MGRIQRISIRNYRSIHGPLDFHFPARAPVVLVGENNAGKSNIVRALDLIPGDSWPGNHEPEDHEFYERDRANLPISITVDVSGVTDPRWGARTVERIVWSFAGQGEVSFNSYFDNDDNRFVNNNVRAQCLCLVVSADRRLSYQLSYTNKFTFLSRLMRHFHDKLMENQNRVDRLQRIFEELRETFGEVHEFSTFTNELRTQVQELSGNLSYALGVDFSAYNPSNYFRALRVIATEDEQTREFEELGTGQEQILALSFVYAYAKAFHDASNLVLVIEEPEAHLHPLAQQWIAKKMRDLALEGVQVVVTSHSPAFLDVQGIDGIVLVRRQGQGTVATQLTKAELATYCRDKGATRATAETILPFYAAAATPEILAGFFAKRVVLVEGATESLAIPDYLAQVGLWADRDGIAVIPVNGVGNLAKWWRLFTAYGIPTYVIFDNDRSTEDTNGSRRTDLLRAIGIEEARFDDLLRIQDWQVEPDFTVFGQNFESTMRRLFGSDYERLEDEAQTNHGLNSDQAKPLVARYAAQRIDLGSYPAGEAFFQSLATAISAVT